MRLILLCLSFFALAVHAQVATDRETRSLKSPEIEAREAELAELYESVLALLMHDIEMRRGIRFDAPPPKVVFSEEDGYAADGVSARYYFETKKLLLDIRFKQCPVQLLLADLHADAGLPRNHWCHFDLVRFKLAHELGHHYVNLLSSRDAPDSWLAKFMKSNEPMLVRDHIAEFLVNEGMAEFFGEEYPLRANWSFNTDSWMAPGVSFYDNRTYWLHIYRGGYALVKPIFEKRGIEDGVRWLLTHELKLSFPDFSPALAYQKQALQ